MLTRRTATVTISAPDASTAAAFWAKSLYLPVPTISREVKVRPATVQLSSGSARPASQFGLLRSRSVIRSMKWMDQRYSRRSRRGVSCNRGMEEGNAVRQRWRSRALALSMPAAVAAQEPDIVVRGDVARTEIERILAADNVDTSRLSAREVADTVGQHRARPRAGGFLGWPTAPMSAPGAARRRRRRKPGDSADPFRNGRAGEGGAGDRRPPSTKWNGSPAPTAPGCRLRPGRSRRPSDARRSPAAHERHDLVIVAVLDPDLAPASSAARSRGCARPPPGVGSSPSSSARSATLMPLATRRCSPLTVIEAVSSTFALLCPSAL